MATEKTPTKAEFLEALRKNGIKSLEDLVDVILPETGGYRILYSKNLEQTPMVTIPIRGFEGLFGFHLSWSEDDVQDD